MGFIKTERLLLLVSSKDLASAVTDFVCRNQDFLKMWEPQKPPEYYTCRYQREAMKADVKSVSDGTGVKFWLVDKTDTATIVGAAELTSIILGNFRSCFIAYRMDKDQQNKGYITEALQVVCDFAYKQLALHRIEANIMQENIASLKVAEKLGFKNEGKAEKLLEINGEWRDHLRMAKINPYL